MKKLLFLIILVVLLAAETVMAAEIGGVVLPETFKAGDTELKLNGYGLRTKFGFKVYAVGMYLKEKSGDNNSILNADQSMALIMNFRRTVPVKKINGVFYDSFAAIVKAPKSDNYDETSDYGPLTKEIVGFMEKFAERKVTKKDRFTFVYTPGKGTVVYLNDSEKESVIITIPGLEFKKALFAIWVGEEAPVGAGLKDKLLGKK